ncbi:MAG: Clp protease N-terminal domain-containing protein [Rothia sp. (in: high G+C Gram-positive bacteria)]|uniref:Clp protease N-terminal domain-containing protein n=1 Tax=Rothia sp. (in: high G+C Gram-positive bacteria) TaxID=1885016 RepID=UPI0026FBE7BD|nr:Clp protease N-terminal domain-containing protein [Rothia sp. (in: high G+C Gram-positive bacteria)]
MTTATRWADYLALITTARTSAATRGSTLIDAQDLLIALTLDPGAVGATLRKQGLTHHKVEAALSSLEHSLLASLGIHQAPARHPLPDLADFTFTERAQKFLQQAPTPQALALALLDEPTGIIQEVVTTCGLTTEMIRQSLKNLGTSTLSDAPQAPADEADPRRLSSTRTVFIPVEIEKVWDLIKEPQELARWVPAIDLVEPNPTDGVWLGYTTELDQVKKFGRVHQESQTRSIRQTKLSQSQSTYRVAYELGFPHQPKFNTQLIEVTLNPQESGTLVQVTSGWLRAPEANLPRNIRWLRRPLGATLRPATRWVATLQAETLAGQIRSAVTQRHNT